MANTLTDQKLAEEQKQAKIQEQFDRFYRMEEMATNLLCAIAMGDPDIVSAAAAKKAWIMADEFEQRRQLKLDEINK